MDKLIQKKKIKEEERKKRLEMIKGKLKERNIGGIMLGYKKRIKYLKGIVWS